MTRTLKIDRAIYLVDDDRRSYSFLARNPDWARLSARQDLANKRSIDGYTRVCRDRHRETFRFRG